MHSSCDMSCDVNWPMDVGDTHSLVSGVTLVCLLSIPYSKKVAEENFASLFKSEDFPVEISQFHSKAAIKGRTFHKVNLQTCPNCKNRTCKWCKIFPLCSRQIHTTLPACVEVIAG